MAYTLPYLICEVGSSKKQPPSDPSFAIGGDSAKFLNVGLTHEVIGPDPEDGGPRLMCVCPNAETARQVKAALDLVSKL
jgi:hypothetical protein